MHIDLPILCLALLMSFAQFVITPYDTLSYFFLAAAILPAMKITPSLMDDIFLGIIVILATLTRETATLILSFYFAIHHKSILGKSFLNPEKIRLLVMTILFLATYWALRWYLGLDDATHKNFRLLLNFSNDPLPIIGALFFPAVISLFFTDGNARKTMAIFLAASTPYWLAMLCVAYPWEIRLWVPIILLMVFLKLCHTYHSQEKTAI